MDNRIVPVPFDRTHLIDVSANKVPADLLGGRERTFQVDFCLRPGFLETGSAQCFSSQVNRKRSFSKVSDRQAHPVHSNALTGFEIGKGGSGTHHHFSPFVLVSDPLHHTDILNDSAEHD